MDPTLFAILEKKAYGFKFLFIQQIDKLHDNGEPQDQLHVVHEKWLQVIKFFVLLERCKHYTKNTFKISLFMVTIIL